MSSRPVTDKTVLALAMDAAAAPSMHNAQPWRFGYSRGSRTFQVRADLARALPHADPDTRALHLGCGAALMNLRVAVAHRGWYPQTRLLPDPGDPTLLATVQLTGTGTGTDTEAESGLDRLYPAVHRRHTSRYPFAEPELPPALRAALTEAAAVEGASLSFPTGWHLGWVLELSRMAAARDAVDSGNAEDLARWTRIGAACADTASDGVPEYAFGPRRRDGRAPMRDFSAHRQVADRGSVEFESSPHLALLSTARDHPADWLRAGQAMERVLLLATCEGLASSFASQATEWPDLRRPLRDPVFGTGSVQMVLRLGRGPQGPRTPRRPAREILDFEA